MPENKLELLTRICALRDERPIVAKPFVVDVDRQQWTVATDGRMLLAFEGTLDGIAGHANKQNARYVASLICDANSASTPCDLDKMRAFAGAPEHPHEFVCESCDGTGKVCSCGECKCQDCVAGKAYNEPEQRDGYIDGRFCDLNLVARLLEGITGAARIRVAAGDTAPLYWSGDGWCAALMPRQDLNPDKECPRWKSDARASRRRRNA
jgi:hypothetical protein